MKCRSAHGNDEEAHSLAIQMSDDVKPRHEHTGTSNEQGSNPRPEENRSRVNAGFQIVGDVLTGIDSVCTLLS